MKKSELSAYFSKLGRKGGKAKWKGVSKEDRSAHARKMALLRHSALSTVARKDA